MRFVTEYIGSTISATTPITQQPQSSRLNNPIIQDTNHPTAAIIQTELPNHPRHQSPNHPLTRSSNSMITAVLLSGGLDSGVLVADEATRGVVQPIYVSAGLAWEAA